VFLRDVQRYFTISKGALIPALYYRPVRQLLVTMSASGELNDLFVFGNQSVANAIALSGGNLDVQRLLRVPDGQSYVVGQRLTVAWDRRDSSFNAHSGTYLLLGVEHADAFPTAGTQADEGHFLRLSQTFSGYVPLTTKIGLALTMRLGEIIQLVPTSTTYPDRYFFMGGFDSMRSYQQESMLPQDAVDQIEASGGKISPSDIAIRGGNLLVNPRAELRIPIAGPFETVIFFDTGNLWQNATYPFEHGITMRAAAGTGLRIQTPVGPLALDYGFNLTKKSYEDIGALNFAIGLF
jgi:outer membrane protein assembly factor BamA